MGLKKADLIRLYESYYGTFSEEFMKDILRCTGRGGVSASRDYTRANRLISILLATVDHSIFPLLTCEKDAKKYIHPAVWFRHDFDSVNLCARYDELKPAQQKELFESDSWMATEKEDGNRGWIILYNVEGLPAVNFLFSRNYSDVDCSLCEYMGNIYQSVNVPKGTILAIDVEVKYEGDVEWLKDYDLIAETPLQAVSSMLQMNSEQSISIQRRFKEDHGQDFFTFKLLYPLYFNGKNYTKRVMKEAHEVYDQVIETVRSYGLNVKPVQRCSGSKEEKEAFLDSILERRGEGVVFHNLNGHYTASENRDKTSWVKLKRSVSASLNKEGLGDTIDAFITGFTKSSEDKGRAHLIGGFEVSIYMMQPDGRTVQHHIASIPGLSMELAEQATIYDSEGKPTLNPDFLGLVLEVDGQTISSKSLRLTHPRMKRIRFDKSKDECIYTRQFIESQIM